MLEMRYVDSKEKYQVAFRKLSDHIVELMGDFPVEISGFLMSRIGKNDEWDYTKYTTVYRNVDGGIQFSNDGSVYVEPPKPLPVIVFDAQSGGMLEGETRFETDKWNEVAVPVPIADEGYVFAGWTPELPTDTEIAESATYTAVFEDHHVYFEVSGGGYLEGAVVQIVEDYSELAIPSPVPTRDYKFVGWSPEIPESGELDMNNMHFTAMFESNIPDRVAETEEAISAINHAMGGE